MTQKTAEAGRRSLGTVEPLSTAALSSPLLGGRGDDVEHASRDRRGAVAAVGDDFETPVQWSVVRGTLPAGVKLSQKTGTISGTPRQSGSFRVTLGARDVLGARSQKTFVLLVTG